MDEIFITPTASYNCENVEVTTYKSQKAKDRDMDKHDSRDIICETCNIAFRAKSHYTKHLTTKKHLRGGKKIMYKCTICDLSSRDKPKLIAHYIKEHNFTGVVLA